MTVLERARAIVAELESRLSHGTVPRSVPWDSGRSSCSDGASGTDGTDGTLGASGAAGSATWQDARRRTVPFAERAVTDAEGERRDRVMTARARAVLVPPSWSALADEQREQIVAQLFALPLPNSDDGQRLIKVTREFFESMYWPLATTQDWTLIELFGINPLAPLVYIDGHGLVTSLALSKLIGGRLETIAANHATIRYRSGSLLTWRRALQVSMARCFGGSAER